MRASKLAPFLLAGALMAITPSAHAQTKALVDGRDWQRSSIEQRRAYLVGVSNVISVGARFDTKYMPPNAETFALRAQKGLEGIRLEPAVAAVDAWYKGHPDELDKPVLSVIWKEASIWRQIATPHRDSAKGLPP